MIVTRLHRLSALALASFALAACQPEPPKMTPEETQPIDALTARMTPRCVGRYLIDLPEDFVLNPIHRAVLEGVEISIKPMGRDYFDIELKDRRNALQKEHPISGGKMPYLRSVVPLSDNSGEVFDRAEESGTAGIGRVLELRAWRNGYSMHLEIHATNYQGAGFNRPDDPPNDTAIKLDHLLKIYSRVRGRADLEVPAEPGVCFANGFLQGEPTDAEQVDLHYHLKTAEDVYFAFHSLSNIESESETLLDRGSAIEQQLKGRKGKTLRKGRRESHGLKFEEWLSMMESDPGVADYYLTLEINSQSVGAVSPLFVLDLNSGVRHPRPRPTLEQAAVQKPLAKATFGAAETMALWDKATATLRPRPANGPATPVKPVTVKPSGAAPAGARAQDSVPKLPLGTTTASLQCCPQCGQWECAAELVAGEKRRRYFPRGMVLPTVIVRGPERSLLQKLKGDPPNRLVETTWTLVSYDLPNADDSGNA